MQNRWVLFVKPSAQKQKAKKRIDRKQTYAKSRKQDGTNWNDKPQSHVKWKLIIYAPTDKTIILIANIIKCILLH